MSKKNEKLMKAIQSLRKAGVFFACPKHYALLFYGKISLLSLELAAKIRFRATSMNKEKELPTLHGEKLYIPFVGAIIERINKEGQKEILIQTRLKKSDPTYSGSIEIPGGKLQAYEDIYHTVKREVKEESGLDINFIQKEEQRIDYINKNDTSTLIEPFCVTQMQNGPFIGLIFLCKATGTPLKMTNETKDVRWIGIDELRKIIQTMPEKIYTAFLGPLKKYLGL